MINFEINQNQIEKGRKNKVHFIPTGCQCFNALHALYARAPTHALLSVLRGTPCRWPEVSLAASGYSSGLGHVSSDAIVCFDPTLVARGQWKS